MSLKKYFVFHKGDCFQSQPLYSPLLMSYSIKFLRCIKDVNLPYLIPNENDGLIIPNIEIKVQMCAMIITTLCLH